jgi:hypothetical protein
LRRREGDRERTTLGDQRQSREAAASERVEASRASPGQWTTGATWGDAEGVGQSSSGVRDGVQSSAVQCSEEAVEMSSKQNGVEAD